MLNDLLAFGEYAFNPANVLLPQPVLFFMLALAPMQRLRSKT
jgi:hypothetical protein